jgi:hypothetical protein
MAGFEKACVRAINRTLAALLAARASDQEKLYVDLRIAASGRSC